VIKTVEKCLQRVSKEVIDRGESADGAASSCGNAFEKLENSLAPGKALEGRFRNKVAAACDPSLNPALEHSEANILGTGPRELHASELGSWCAWFGGDGSVDSFDEWLDCMVSANTCSAHVAVSVHFPRTLEWLAAVEAVLAAEVPPPADAITAINAVRESLEGGDADLINEQRCGASLFPASGQTTAYTAIRGGAGVATAENEDGTLRPGTTLRFADNGDGTIRDLNTGLMWEKKVAGDGLANLGNLHDADNGYVWSDIFNMGNDSVWDWIDDINSEGGTGFAGFNDWRVPSLKELQSIVDYENNNPAAPAELHNSATCAGCSDLGSTSCSCTDVDAYWSSTTRKQNIGQAWTVDFSDGAVSANGKGSAKAVRAVRLGH